MIKTLAYPPDRHVDVNRKGHKEIMGAIKLSYAGLGKRITTPESQIEDLKRRMDKIERKPLFMNQGSSRPSANVLF